MRRRLAAGIYCVGSLWDIPYKGKTALVKLHLPNRMVEVKFYEDEIQLGDVYFSLDVEEAFELGWLEVVAYYFRCAQALPKKNAVEYHKHLAKSNSYLTEICDPWMRACNIIKSRQVMEWRQKYEEAFVPAMQHVKEGCKIANGTKIYFEDLYLSETLTAYKARVQIALDEAAIANKACCEVPWE